MSDSKFSQLPNVKSKVEKYHHQYTHQATDSGRKLILTMFLNLIITIVEIIGGIISGSLSLISDALHNLSDGFSSLISYIAIRISKRNQSEKNTFGYKRVTILAAFINSIVLVVISFYLFEQAYLKIINPNIVNGSIVIWVAFIGLTANVISTYILHKGSKNDLNIKATYLHLLSDALSSIGVIVGGVLILLFKAYWIDPVLTILIGLYIFKEAISIIKEASNILMQGTPHDIDINKLNRKLKELDNLENIHHVHLWSLNDKMIFLELHVNLKKDVMVSKTDKLSTEIETIAHDYFGVSHITIHFEFNQCEDQSLIKK